MRRRGWPLSLMVACTPATPSPSASPIPTANARPIASVTPSAITPSAVAPIASGPLAIAGATVTSPAPCPGDMEYVDTVFCPDVHQACLSHSRNAPNRLTICHRFAKTRSCSAAQRRQRFCIDRYEYPSVKGAHPPVMVSAFDAAALCAEKGKRMCWQSEWTAACEGPEKLPFPYGLTRDAAKCNIDNRYVHPDLDLVHSSRHEQRGPELLRLDQSVLSGAREECKSGFGVYDLPGNFDEWVRTETIRGEGRWAGLKGGAWGFVRNACRPITTSHVAHWSYYFISFRCCRDPEPSSVGAPPSGAALWTPPATPVPPRPAGHSLDRGWAPAADAVRPNAPVR